MFARRIAGRCRIQDSVGRASMLKNTAVSRHHRPPATVVRWSHDSGSERLLPSLVENSQNHSALDDVSLLPRGTGTREHGFSAKAHRSVGQSPMRKRKKRNAGGKRGSVSGKSENQTTRRSIFGKQLPKYEIHRWYVDHHPEFEFDEQTYQFSGMKDDSRTSWLTATFTCPVTQQVYESGTFRTLERWGESKVLNSKVHYRNLTSAVHAAAARAMDSIQFQEKGLSEPRLCEEDPSIASTDRLLLGKQSPKWHLHSFYLHRHGIPRFDNDVYRLTDHPDEEGWNTATFTCPVTKKLYESGTLIDPMEEQWGERRLMDGRCYYKSEKSALHAAAARALDAISFEENGTTEPRLCQEAPDSLDVAGYTRVEGAREVAPVDVASDGTKVGTGEQQELMNTPAPLKITPASIQHYVVPEDEEEHEYTIQSIAPASSLSCGFQDKSTLERVLEAWAESFSKPGVEARLSARGSGHAPMKRSPTRQKQSAVMDASAWYHQMQFLSGERGSGGRHSEFHHDIASVTVTLAAGNAMLKALANANDLSSEDHKVNQNLEDMANNVLRFMWTCNERPNVETYNAYLRCLARSDPIVAARGAEKVLRSMEETSLWDKSQPSLGTLPLPNIDTYNATMMLWQHVGGDLGYKKCEEVMSYLEKESIRDGLKVVPSRETFLILLSSMANPGDEKSTFCKDRALEWIERMRSLSVSNVDQTMLTDSIVYNAPLRWSSGVDGITSRPFARRLPWDAYEVIFAKGFRCSAEDTLLTEARQAEEWLLHMQGESDVSPDAQTYESIIQAWVRVGTKEAVKNAEIWAMRAIDSGAEVRLQTFHPILASWAYSGDARAPGKVRYRIDRLEELSGTSPEATPDGRMYLALMIAWSGYQRRLIEEQRADDKDTNMVATLETCAQSCTDILEEILAKMASEEETESEFFMDATAFAQAAGSWGELALYCQTIRAFEKEADTLTKSVTTMIATMRRMHATIQSLRESHREEIAVSPHDDFDEEYAARDLQLRHMVTNATTCHLEVLTYLNKIDAARSSLDEPSFFMKCLPDVELMIRRSEEYKRLIYQHPRGKKTSTRSIEESSEPAAAIFSDLFEYHPRLAGTDMNYAEAHAAMLSAVLEGCRIDFDRSAKSAGDRARLCSLILNYARREGNDHLITSGRSVISSIRSRYGRGTLSDDSDEGESTKRSHPTRFKQNIKTKGGRRVQRKKPRRVSSAQQ